MSLKHVTIDGKRRPIAFDNGAIDLFAESTGAPFSVLSESIEKWPAHYLFGLIWAGFVSGAEIKGEDFPFTRRQVARWFDSADKMQEVFKVFEDSQPKKTDEGDEGNAEKA